MPSPPLDSCFELADISAANLQAALGDQLELAERLRSGLQLKTPVRPAAVDDVAREQLVAATIRTDILLRNLRADWDLLARLRSTLLEIRKNCEGMVMHARIGV